MSLTPEQAQEMVDLRQKMYINMQAGKPSTEGISEEEVARVWAYMRANRTQSAEAGGAKKKAGAKSTVVVDTKAFTDADLD